MRTSALVTAAACSLALVVFVGSAVASPDRGNSANAKLCQKDGFRAWFARDGRPFANAGECTAYGTRDTLVPATALACLDAGWRTLAPVEGGSPFADEDACIAFAAAGGTPRATGGADISLAYDPLTRQVTVSNAGPLPATVSLLSSFLGVCSLGFDFDSSVWAPGPPSLRLRAPIPAGGTVGGITIVSASCSEGLVGIQVVESDQPDPDSTPGNHVVTEDDYVVIARAAP